MFIVLIEIYYQRHTDQFCWLVEMWQGDKQTFQGGW